MYNYNLGKLFYSVVEENFDKTAIYFSEENQVSFDSLNRLSNQIAICLIKYELRNNDVVGIFNTKTFESYALMLACLKIGVIYVNLDNSSPVERLNKIIDRCIPKYLFFDDEAFVDKIAFFKTSVINIKAPEVIKQIATYSDLNLTITGSVCSDNPAYIMFTSGSTGFPKGAVMTHQNLLNFISWAKGEYQINPSDRFTNVNPMYFDNSVFDFYASLFNGASMAPFDSETVQHPDRIVDRVNEVKATIWFSVPSLLVFLLVTKSLTSNDFENIRIITFGGEGFPKPKLKQLYDIYKERVRFVNVYGPTECTCICSAYNIKGSDFEDMINLAPLGKLAPNFDYIILNMDTDTGVGELCLTGPQVGLGYYNDPERTLNSFVLNPQKMMINQPIYKTGDLVKVDENNFLYIIGRTDNQIKHMGYRIELEEIESCFNSLPYVEESGVVYQKLENGLGQIIACLALGKQTNKAEILGDIKQILPSYMVPKQIIFFDHLPKNKNGKIDRIELMNLI